MKKPKQEESLTVITAMVAAQVLHETLDELQGTSFYKHKLKQISKQFEEELSKQCNRTISELYNTDEETMQLLTQEIHEIAKKLATIHPVKIQEIRACLKQIK